MADIYRDTFDSRMDHDPLVIQLRDALAAARPDAGVQALPRPSSGVKKPAAAHGEFTLIYLCNSFTHKPTESRSGSAHRRRAKKTRV
jgi:hypothetical protein